MTELYIGLMSGTSLDGIDAALVAFPEGRAKLVASHYEKMPDALRAALLDLCQPGFDEINRLGQFDIALGKEFARCVQLLLEKNQLKANQIQAIGSHGQTIRHHPGLRFTLQIGDPNVIAAETGITTVADFRRRDMALAGQGAPLVPAFHQHFFATPSVNRVILNLGGIANVTVLPRDQHQAIIGFDTGPANTLLDAWAEEHLHQTYDTSGAWAQQGKVNEALLSHLLNDPFFSLSPPKSTGREYFNLAWLRTFLTPDLRPIDVQATLVELTVQSVLMAIKKLLANGEIIVCGGGAHNQFLMKRLTQLAEPFTVNSTQALGIDPDWVEAMAFAWLAKQTLMKQPGNIHTVTGASKASILGGVYYA